MRRQHTQEHTVLRFTDKLINLSWAAFHYTNCCVLSIICTLHMQHTVHQALSRSDGHKARLRGTLTRSLWNVYSDALPECFAVEELSGLFRLGHILLTVFSLSGVNPSPSVPLLLLWSWPVAAWTQRVLQKRKQSVDRERGEEIVINCQSQGSIQPFPRQH